MMRTLQIFAFLTLAIFLPAPTASAQRHKSCVVDPEMAAIQLPSCALQKRNGQSYIAPQYLHLFDFSATPPLAYTSTEEMGWVYFDRRGHILVKNVANMDNSASEFHFGLVRVTVNEKWGLADAQGKLVVPLQYDGILDYSKLHGWDACTGCRTIESDEHAWFQGGTWVSLDRLGQVIPRGNKEKPLP